VFLNSWCLKKQRTLQSAPVAVRILKPQALASFYLALGQNVREQVSQEEGRISILALVQVARSRRANR